MNHLSNFGEALSDNSDQMQINYFSEPLNLVSNINGGYGGWTGYGSVYYRVPIIDGFSTNSFYLQIQLK